MSGVDPAALPIRAQVISMQTSLEAELHAPVPTPTRGEVAPAALPWRTGERLQAVVESALAGSRYLVRIDQLAFDMQLPTDVRIGDRLRLAYAGATPRPQFVLLQEQSARAPEVSTRLDLSREGRALAAAVAPNNPHEAPLARNASTLLATPVPLLQATAQSTATLVSALKQAIDSSGLFYESHLGEWIEGHRSGENLLREPQGRLPPVAQAPTQEAEAKPADGTDPASVTPAKDAALASGPQKAEPAAIHPQALPLVRAQLDTLETGQILWAGQAWPGQSLEWQLQQVHDEGRSPDEPTPWATRLRLTLPRLGALTADLQLTGSRLQLRLAAAEPAARAELEGARQVLVDALSAAGLALTGFATVDQHD